VRVVSHQIEAISTHQKIGHSASIKWYQLSRLIGEFYRVFFLSYSSQKPNKNYFRLDPCPTNHLLALHILSISVFVEFVCLLFQLLLVTCVSSLFHLTLAVTPTVTPPPLGSPSLSRGAVGQKKEREKKKKRKAIQKRNKKRERIRKKRETAAQSKWETGIDSSR
jgi:hypothetical protein